MRIVRIIIPYYNINEIDFYYHLMESFHKFAHISINILYVIGETEEDFPVKFSFHKLEVSRKFKKSLQPLLYGIDICRQVKKIDGDVIFVISDPWALNFSRLCLKRLGIPYVVWMRGDHPEVRKLRKVNPVKRIITNHLEVRCLNDATFVVPNCMKLYERLRKWGVKKEKITEPVHNGVDCEIFRPLNIPRSEKFTVGFAGRICPEKRVIELLRIAKVLKSQNIEFVIAGRKEMEVTFPENVRYLGRLSFFEMPRFYNMIDLLVLPSATEGFPSVILEAYACEKPVLISKEASPKELRVFGAVSVLEKFKDEILKLKQEDLKDIGKEARRYVRENLSWEQFANRITEYLEKAVRYHR